MKSSYNKKKIFITSSIIFILAYVFNLVWEYLHYPLYICDLSQIFCAFYASFIDALIVLGIFFAGSFIFNELFWIEKLNKRKITILLVGSFVIAYIIELRALYEEKWAYAVSMPIIPFVDVGLSPILQMMILPLLIFIITKNILKKRGI